MSYKEYYARRPIRFHAGILPGTFLLSYDRRHPVIAFNSVRALEELRDAADAVLRGEVEAAKVEAEKP